jgi:predicted  nucleic acid-binding Zn-ribbon protein
VGTSQSRVAAFLTSSSADDLVQQIQTIDLIANHTNLVIAEVSAAQKAAAQAQAAADETAAAAEKSLADVEAQKQQLQQQLDAYRADFRRLSAQEQAAVMAAVAGPTLEAPSVDQSGYRFAKRIVG